MKVQALRNFRRNLRTALDNRGLSQREIAERVGVSYPYVNRILTSKVAPSLPICDRFADALKLSLAELLLSPSEFSEVDLQAVSQ